jgi:hypothetical protein
MRSTEPFSPEFGAALLRFNEEAAFYCGDISDADAHEYAMNYARILQSRAKGLEPEPTRFPAYVLGPQRNLAKTALDKMYRKYFCSRLLGL